MRGKRVVDVGCGGGILAESMAERGADVTGIDLSEKALAVARLHLLETGGKVDYRHIAAEQLAAEQPAAFDVVTCLEMLEHVPDPASTIRACATLVKPGGHVFFSTISRNPKAYLLAVVGAEYVLNLLPRGTHDYAKVHPAVRTGAHGARSRPRRRGSHRHDLQPAYTALFPRPGHQRELPAARSTQCLRPSFSTSTAPSPTPHPTSAAALNRLLAEQGRAALPLRRAAPACLGRCPRPAARRLRHRAGRRRPTRHCTSASSNIYENALCEATTLFDGMDTLLDALEAQGIAWGVVTNKPERFTLPLMEALGLATRAAAIVGGDTTARAKPDPLPLLHACTVAGVAATASAYVGDDLRDIQAGRAAGMRTFAAAWGYLGDGPPIDDWGADSMIAEPDRAAGRHRCGVAVACQRHVFGAPRRRCPTALFWFVA